MLDNNIIRPCGLSYARYLYLLPPSPYTGPPLPLVTAGVFSTSMSLLLSVIFTSLLHFSRFHI